MKKYRWKIFRKIRTLGSLIPLAYSDQEFFGAVCWRYPDLTYGFIVF